VVGADPPGVSQDAVGLVRRGDAHHTRKEYNQAIADYDRAVQIDPKLGKMLNPKLAAAFYARGKASYNNRQGLVQ
jgi:hypothetical protein